MVNASFFCSSAFTSCLVCQPTGLHLILVLMEMCGAGPGGSNMMNVFHFYSQMFMEQMKDNISRLLFSYWRFIDLITQESASIEMKDWSVILRHLITFSCLQCMSCLVWFCWTAFIRQLAWFEWLYQPIIAAISLWNGCGKPGKSYSNEIRKVMERVEVVSSPGERCMEEFGPF